MIIGKAISPFALRKKNGGGGGGYDADAQAFITATGISGTNATATNQLVLDLKAANIWTKMKAIYPFVGNTSASQKYNLKDSRDLDAAYRLTFFGGGTFSANGYQCNGTNSYGNTFIDWLNDTVDSISFDNIFAQNPLYKDKYKFMPYIINSIPSIILIYLFSNYNIYFKYYIYHVYFIIY